MDRVEFEAELRRDGFVEIGEASVPPGTDREEHAHPFEVRALMLGGTLHLTCDGAEHGYRPGEIFTMAAGHDHRERTGPDGAHYVVGRKHA